MFPRPVLAVYIFHCVYSAQKNPSGDIDGICPGPPTQEDAHVIEGQHWDVYSGKGSNKWDDDVALLQTTIPLEKIRKRKIEHGFAKDDAGKSLSRHNQPFPALSPQSNISSDDRLLDRHGRSEFRKPQLGPEPNSTNTTGTTYNNGPAPHLQDEHMVDSYASQHLKEREGEVTALFEVVRKQGKIHTSSRTKRGAGFVIFLAVLVLSLLALLGIALHLRNSRREGKSSETQASQIGHGSQNPLRDDSWTSFTLPGSSVFGSTQEQPCSPVSQPLFPSSLPPPTPQTPKQQPTQSRGPPPIYPNLILAKTEARFMVPIQDMKQVTAGKRINIIGKSWRPLLTLSVSDTSDGRKCMSFASVGSEDNPKMQIMIPADAQGPLIMEVYAQNSTMYGTLEITDGASPTKSVLKCSGVPVMKVEFTNMPELLMTAVNIDGLPVGWSGKQTPPHFGRNDVREVWNVSVSAGEDAILIAGCMLAMCLGSPLMPASPPA